LKIPERVAFPAPKAAVVDDTGTSAPASGPAVAGAQADSPEHVFVREITPRAKAVAEKLGLSPDVLVAQAALETGWGQHIIKHPDGSSSNNLFGIKADRRWDGPIVRVATLEYLGGRPVRVNAAFRAYQGIDESLQDYVDFLSGNPRYREALDAAPEPRRFARALADAGYATDPDYADKLNAIHRRIAAMDLDSPPRL
jgi:flagellar protein FlgJ